MKNKIFHTQDLCLRTNLRCAKNSAGIEIIKEVVTAFLVENSMYKSHNTSHILQIREKQTVQGVVIEKLLLFMREVHNKKIHSYPKKMF